MVKEELSGSNQRVFEGHDSAKKKEDVVNEKLHKLLEYIANGPH
jgi:hypothetical protein